MNIVTITLNPALDLTTRLEAMSLGEVNLVSEAHLRAAGKGIKVTLVVGRATASATATRRSPR